MDVGNVQVGESCVGVVGDVLRSFSLGLGDKEKISTYCVQVLAVNNEVLQKRTDPKGEKKGVQIHYTLALYVEHSTS